MIPSKNYVKEIVWKEGRQSKAYKETIHQTLYLTAEIYTVTYTRKVDKGHLQYSLEYTVIQRRYAHIVLIGCTRAYLIRCYTVMIHTLCFDLIHSLMIMHMMMMTRIDNLYNTYTVKLERYSGAYTYVQWYVLYTLWWFIHYDDAYLMMMIMLGHLIHSPWWCIVWWCKNTVWWG